MNFHILPSFLVIFPETCYIIVFSNLKKWIFIKKIEKQEKVSIFEHFCPLQFSWIQCQNVSHSISFLTPSENFGTARGFRASG